MMVAAKSFGRNLGVAASLAALFALAAPVAATAQPRPPAAIGETMDIGDEPGRISTEEVTITEGPFARQMVFFRSNEAPGTVVIHSAERFLYVVQPGNKALRYGIGVGREGFQWSGLVKVSRKAEWPDWRPPPEMIARQPETIGQSISSGCFRLANGDIIDLYQRVPIGTKVVVRHKASI
jgi:lipoprotein-anchoring transpeptidase ErfK/SrfK